VPAGTRCLLADCEGVGREHPWSIEKLSPTLAFFVADGVERGAARCNEILQFGGMGHTAGMHTSDRAAAIRFGMEMPASRVVINSGTTQGAIGLSTGLPPSMTLGCGSWGGNVTSDNVSPVHLIDIKRVAFETKPIMQPKPHSTPQPSANTAHEKRERIAALVDSVLSRKLAAVPSQPKPVAAAPAPPPMVVETPPVPAPAEAPARTIIHELRPQKEIDESRVPVDFVSEADVREALGKGKKIYITSKTILTPSARDLGNEKDIFAKV
jgi:hypothetical protein